MALGCYFESVNENLWERVEYLLSSPWTVVYLKKKVDPYIIPIHKKSVHLEWNFNGTSF